MGIKQQKVGKDFEWEILNYYNKRHYFTYKFPTDFNGTVCDIIVAKGGACLMIECKHTTDSKLYYKGCGIFKKRDELDRFVKRTNNNVYIYIKSDEIGYYWTTWVMAKPIFEEKGYLDLKEDCFSADLGNM